VIAASLVLRLPRDAASVPLTRRVLDAALASLGATPDCRGDVQLALSEACTNVVTHGGDSPEYEVSIGFDERQCTIEVTDEGPGIPPGNVDPTAPMPTPVAESGRGLHIISLVVDEIEVRPRRPRGTLLRFVKRLTWNPDQPNSSATPRPR
jgi:serine/threonine-protein kinase RsbW